MGRGVTLTHVECRRCRASVAVEKSSWHQTSVQWSGRTALSCPSLTASMDSHPALSRCPDVHASIKAATMEGLMGEFD
ncbi:hypothetical protein EEB12_30220 [Rhodococcus sp. WS1]|nr:hypothetical protein EEB12_30220 [Rhodococcus sp. WS1]TQC34595.1 hypothetical protein EEB16_28215 [Rhodococcus sp. WS7]